MDSKKRRKVKAEKKQILIYLYELCGGDNKKVNDIIMYNEFKATTEDMIKSNQENNYQEQDYIAITDKGFKKYAKLNELKDYELISKLLN